LGGQKRSGRASERRREWLTDCRNDARKRERGEEGRERRDQDRHNTQKSGGEGAPIEIGTGGVRESDERGDRRLEGRGEAETSAERGEWGGRGTTGVASETKETRGQKLFSEEGSERNASSALAILHVQNGQLSV
jgi:hypothetical protein